MPSNCRKSRKTNRKTRKSGGVPFSFGTKVHPETGMSAWGSKPVNPSAIVTATPSANVTATPSANARQIRNYTNYISRNALLPGEAQNTVRAPRTAEAPRTAVSKPLRSVNNLLGELSENGNGNENTQQGFFSSIGKAVGKAVGLTPVTDYINKKYSDSPGDILHIKSMALVIRGTNDLQKGLNNSTKYFNILSEAFGNSISNTNSNNAVNAVLEEARAGIQPVKGTFNNVSGLNNFMKKEEENIDANDKALNDDAKKLADSGEPIDLAESQKAAVTNIISRAKAIRGVSGGTRRKSGGGGGQSRAANPIMNELKAIANKAKQNADEARKIANNAIKKVRNNNKTAKVLNKNAQAALNRAQNLVSKRR